MKASALKSSSHDRILRAARQLFASRGYESTGTAAIARAAGTSESQLMKHFGSKEGLLEAIFEQAWGRINTGARQIAESDLSPRRKLDSLSGLLLRALAADPEIQLLMLLEGRRIRKEAQRVVITPGFQDFIDLLDRVLRDLQKAGHIRRDVHLQAMRSALMGAFEGLIRDQMLARRIGFPARYSRKHAEKTLNILVAAFLSARHR